MKKSLFLPKVILILLLLLIIVFMASKEMCQSSNKESKQNVPNTNPLRLLIDVEFGSSLSLDIKDELNHYLTEGDGRGNVITRNYQSVIKMNGGPQDITFEFPPSCGVEREFYLTRLRTELMAGKGPDVFVCISGFGGKYDSTTRQYIMEDAIFPFPQQAMKRGMFLPLDTYIPNSQFMEWSKLTSTIMEAGHTAQGQLLLPMTYTIPATAFPKDDVEHELSQNMTWEEMLSGNIAMRIAGVLDESAYIALALEPFIDINNDTLAISEEEMRLFFFTRLKERQFLESENTPTHFRGWMQVDLNDEIINTEQPGVGRGNEYTYIPIYTRGGGYRAIVTSFTCINANTFRPDDAFFLVDYLMSEECQRSILYSYMTYDNAVPIMEGLMTEEKPVSAVHKKWHMRENDYHEFLGLRDGLSGADFCTSLCKEVWNLNKSLQQEGSDLEKEIHKSYVKMNMELAES